MHEQLIHRKNSPSTPFPVYRASGSWVLGANHTDIATFTAGSRIAHVSRIYLSMVQSANGIVGLKLLRRTTAATGGTSADVAPSKGDSRNQDPTSVLKAYTAAPTVGTAGGAIRTTPQLISGGGSNVGIVEWAFIPETPRGLVLNPGEILAVQAVNGDPTGTIYMTFEWYENLDS